jgi:hypothetical protein
VTLDLDLLPGDYAICRCPAGAPLPVWVPRDGFVSATRTPAELSVVCAADAVPAGIRRESPFRIFAVRGPLDFGLVGVMASLTSPLAASGVSIFALSTFDTDYVLVRAAAVDRATEALRHAGHHVVVKRKRRGQLKLAPTKKIRRA